MPAALIHIGYHGGAEARQGYPAVYLYPPGQDPILYQAAIPGHYEPVLRTFDEAGNLLRSFSATDTYPIYPLAMVANAVGDVYLGGLMVRTVADETNGVGGLIRINRDSQRIDDFSAYHPAPIYSLALDSSGNLYLFGEEVNDAGVLFSSGSHDGFYNLRKFNAAGIQQWKVNIFASEFSGLQHYYLVDDPSILSGTQIQPPFSSIGLGYDSPIGVDSSGNVWIGFVLKTLVWDDMNANTYNKSFSYAVLKKVKREGGTKRNLDLETKRNNVN